MTTPSQAATSACSSQDEVDLLSDLTALESELVGAARRGGVLDCGEMPIDELATTDDPGRLVRAEVIRELLLGRRGQLDPRGVRIRWARINGVLDLNHVQAHVLLLLNQCVLDELCELNHAHLPHLDLDGCRLTQLHGERLEVDGDLYLGGGFRATGGGERGTLRLRGAHIGGQLVMSGAELTNDTGPALHADGLQVDHDLVLDDGFRASGGGERGTVRLLRARVGGVLSMNGAELTSDAGPALNAQGLQVGQILFLRDGFRATGSGERGTVRLHSAHIGGQLNLSGADLANDTGPALQADAVQVDRGLFLHGGFRATGGGERGTVCMRAAHIGGPFNMLGASLHRTSAGPILDLVNVAAVALLVPSGLICPYQATTTTPCSDTSRRVDLEGLTYSALHPITWQQWLHLLRRHSTGYAAQPYQQLAAAQRARGHDGPARCILVAQQEDLRQRGDLGRWPTTLIHRLWGALAGYGYRTGRLIAALVLAILIAGALGVLAGHTPIRDGRYVAAHTTRTEHPNTPCSFTEQIGLGIDRGLPLGTTGLRDRCDLDTTSRRGQAITIAIWTIQALVWALATLAIAGYTGLIRKIT